MPPREPTSPDRLRERFGRRATGVVAALALEALLLALLLTLGRTSFEPEGEPEALVSFDVGPPPEQAAAVEPQAEPASEAPAEEDVPAPVTEPVRLDPVPDLQSEPLRPSPAPPRDVAIVPLSREDLASADISNQPSRQSNEPAGPTYGPRMAASPGDSEVVGRAPNGEPLYAARWFREPTDGELRGYLSTASGPGWALIACRTAARWRVEDCVGLDEHPTGSNIQRAVLAAAWQFQVRPPRRGGESLVGSWVRIRIDYARR